MTRCIVKGDPQTQSMYWLLQVLKKDENIPDDIYFTLLLDRRNGFSTTFIENKFMIYFCKFQFTFVSFALLTHFIDSKGSLN